MSYLDRNTDPRGRTTAISGVILIHAALLYILVTGLVQTFVPHPRDTFSGYITPETKPPPKPRPEERRKPSAQAQRETVKTQQTELTKTDNTVTETTDQHHEVEVIPTATATYTPPTSLGFKPKAATPRNEPARWATTDDYPSRDLRLGNEGTAVFRAIIASDGRVSACEIVRSSGHPGLDAATCKAVTSRARFEPATDENGQKVVGIYTNSVRWQIPH